ncbi:MAG TPA: M90 family metallopeptidase [Rhodothermales bacterium]|nr:M90 family metallopeptidase [Rhodothermales bacterium]
MHIARPGTLLFHALLAIILGVGVGVVGAQTITYGGWFALIPVLIVAWRGIRQPWQRWRTSHKPFPATWRDWLDAHVPFYATLDTDGRVHFERDIQFFCAEQPFEGVDGVVVTDKLKLAVAAGAALMLHGRPGWELGTDRTILFYPAHFDEDYYETAYAKYDGMVHAQGPIIFSKASVESDWAHPGTGHNVVIHELAHLFDMADAVAEGVPSLMDRSSAKAWGQLVRREMQHIRLGKSLLRRYAATKPAEFFAVAAENFFDRPQQLYDHHPELFEALTAFFNFDPRPAEAVVPVAEAEVEIQGNGTLHPD